MTGRRRRRRRGEEKRRQEGNPAEKSSPVPPPPSLLAVYELFVWMLAMLAWTGAADAALDQGCRVSDKNSFETSADDVGGL